MKFVLMYDKLNNWFNKNLSIVRRGVSFNKAIQTLLEIALNLTVEEILKKLFDIVGMEYTAIHPKYLAY